MKFNLINSVYDTNKRAEAEEGIEIQLEPGMVFVVRRAGGANKQFAEALSRRRRPYRKEIERETIDPEVLQTRVLIPAYLDAVIMGWSGSVFQDPETGEAIPFSRKAATEFFKQYPDTFLDLIDATTDKANWSRARWEEAGESLGN